MDRRFHEEKEMTARRHTKLVHEGKYVAEVEIKLIEADIGWAPYLSLDSCGDVERRRAGGRTALPSRDGGRRMFPVF